jgi:excisionase family DNA binding protein
LSKGTTLIDEQIRARELSRVEYHLDRARKLGLPATLTLDEWLETLNHFQWACAYCRLPYEVLEHFIPFNLQGETSKTNCIPSCTSCNQKKQGSHPGTLSWVEPSTLLYIRSYLAAVSTGNIIQEPALPPIAPEEDVDATYTISDIRRRFHVSERTVRRWIQEGKLHSTLVQGIRKFSEADIAAIMPSSMHVTWFTFKEVQQRFKISERTLRRWLHLGTIEAIHLGRQLRFEEHEIKRFMDLRRRAAKRKAS